MKSLKMTKKLQILPTTIGGLENFEIILTAYG